MVTVDGRFALLDKDGGGAVFLSGFRRLISFDASSAAPGDLESVFADIESAALHGEWLVVAADYGLGTCFEPALAGNADNRRTLRAWAFGQAQTLDSAELNAFFSGQLAAIPEHARIAGVAEMRVAVDAEDYTRKVELIRAWITAGDCYQVNLTFPID